MRLLSCRIENFGKLTDFTYDFEEDLNMLFAENGWGKSTLAAFLGVMFYGFEGENKRTEESNERMRYRPWQGGVYGGSVTFRCKERSYRMLRVFGTRKKEDVFTLFDDGTGLVSDAFSDRIGEELFGIDRDSFRRTVFWSQQDHETSATTLIQAKIGDLIAEQDDLPAYDAAMKQLQREAERLRPDRASGLIRKKEERLRALEADEVRLPLLTEELEELAHKKEALETELENIRAERQQLAMKAAAVPDPSASHDPSASYDPSASHNPSVSYELKVLRSRLNASRDRIRTLSAAGRKISLRGHRELGELQEVRKALKREKASESARIRTLSKRLHAVSCLCLAAALIMAVAVFARILPALMLIPALLAAAAGIAVIAGLRLNDISPDSPAAGHLRGEEERLRSSLQALSVRLKKVRKEIREEKKYYSELRNRLALREQHSQDSRLTAAEHTAPDDYAASGRLAEPDVYAASGRHAEPDDNSVPAPAPDSDEIRKILTELDAREENCRQRLLDISRQSEELRSGIRDCRESRELLPALREEIRVLRERYSTCTMTIRYLEEARNAFNARYMNPFLRSFARYYSLLTGESAQDLQTDADFSISVMREGLPRDPSLMSEGTKDLISLCRRMAMIDAMYPGEKPFLVLDDPFANLDDERVKGGLRFLHSASLEYQILYLTCHRSRM